jgi:hypothetical protein
MLELAGNGLLIFTDALSFVCSRSSLECFQVQFVSRRELVLPRHQAAPRLAGEHELRQRAEAPDFSMEDVC